MSRITSVPRITIEMSTFDDDEVTGRVICHPVIRADADGFSLGTLALNEMQDLHILRNRINHYISLLNIPAPDMEDLDEKQAPQFAAVIEGYLSGYKPMNRANFNPKRMTVRTSQEIILDLADMVDITLNEVAEAMSYLGYCTVSYDHKVGWLLGSVTSDK